jgi:hypothetical protein
MKPITEYGTPEWFANRVKDSLINRGEGFWDFSDSVILWTDESVKSYENAQTKDQDAYKMQITDSESKYLKKIAPNLVSYLPDRINFIDMGPGTENKQDIFIEEIKKTGKEFIYTPVDINKKILNLAVDHMKRYGVTTIPIHSTFEDMEQFITDKETPRFLSLGLTFSNFNIEDILSILKKSLNKNSFAFINTQPRERVKEPGSLIKAYSSKYALELYNLKLKLIGLEIDNKIGNIEVTGDVKVYYHVKNPSAKAQGFGIKAGDKIFGFQSMRYPIDFLKSRLEKDFDCKYFDVQDEYLAVLLEIR